ncbi:protein PTST, chloroplastic isoform X2 [Aristolochia californica]|uniref:protein PTST, chloroplastic isoform X2 n=1 Tax=Aristolochia californica TaxID=171875 RepID=UPI0035D7BC7D
MIGATRCCLQKSTSWFSCHSRFEDWQYIQKPPCTVQVNSIRVTCTGFTVVPNAFCRGLYDGLIGIGLDVHNLGFKQPSWKTFAVPVDVEEEPSPDPWEETSETDGEFVPEDPSGRISPKKLNSEEIKALLVDSERAKLLKKLTEANQHNRFLKRQLLLKEDALVDCKSELAAMELELQNLIKLAEEVAEFGEQLGLRKINGKSIPSYLLSRLEAFQGNLKEQVKGVDAAKYKDVELLWFGMAETVQVVGSFDGWSEGEHMSAECTGNFTKFSATLKLRPGRYEIKFLVDGQWHLSPELPVIGEGMMQNNLLVVE